MKNIPLRKCLVSNMMLPKEELFRVVKNKSGEVSLDLTGKSNGRGAYLKKDKDVILLARKKKVLNRALEASIDDALYEEMLNALEKE